MAHEYITSAELKTAIDLTGETFADDDIVGAIAAASKSVEKITRRRFWKDADATSVRYYSPRSSSLVEIDDLVDLTEFATGPGDNTFGAAWTENTDFRLAPLNAAADGRPWKHVKTVVQSLTVGIATVRVTGQFGWDAVPDEVVEATTILASRFLRRAKDAPFGALNMGFEGVVARVTRTDPDVCNLLYPLTRPLVR